MKVKKYEAGFFITSVVTFLETQDILFNFRLVCKRWNDVVNQKTFDDYPTLDTRFSLRDIIWDTPPRYFHRFQKIRINLNDNSARNWDKFADLCHNNFDNLKSIAFYIFEDDDFFVTERTEPLLKAFIHRLLEKSQESLIHLHLPLLYIPVRLKHLQTLTIEIEDQEIPIERSQLIEALSNININAMKKLLLRECNIKRDACEYLCSYYGDFLHTGCPRTINSLDFKILRQVKDFASLFRHRDELHLSNVEYLEITTSGWAHYIPLGFRDLLLHPEWLPDRYMPNLKAVYFKKPFVAGYGEATKRITMEAYESIKKFMLESGIKLLEKSEFYDSIEESWKDRFGISALYVWF